jgi:hypothetical protein
VREKRRDGKEKVGVVAKEWTRADNRPSLRSDATSWLLSAPHQDRPCSLGGVVVVWPVLGKPCIQREWGYSAVPGCRGEGIPARSVTEWDDPGIPNWAGRDKVVSVGMLQPESGQSGVVWRTL